MNSLDLTGFVAYPSLPKEIGNSIRMACLEIKRQLPSANIEPWEANQIAGYCLIDPILEKIKSSNILIADVTRLNFNVIYEIGYAIGLKKRVFLIRNKSVVSDPQLSREVSAAGFGPGAGWLSLINCNSFASSSSNRATSFSSMNEMRNSP
ncbi:MAG: hypothetical protein ABSF51_11595 [Verrucomicrobiota bacterium]